MINYIKNLIKLFGLSLNFAGKARFQKKFLLDKLGTTIEQSKETNDGSLDDEDFKKISLYGYAIPALLGEAYCVLKGNQMSEKERFAMTCLGTLTGLFDDFFDKRNMTVSRIKLLIENSIEDQSANSNERLFIILYNNVLENCSDIDLVKNYCTKVFEAQILSKRQLQSDISRDELKDITSQKGGVSILLYSSTLKDSLTEGEKNILFKLGGIGQLENDIFDVYKDYAAGIQTLVTTETKINNLRKTYTILIEEIFGLVHQTNYLLKNKQDFLRIVALVVCRAYVCLDLLEKNEKSTNNIFSIANYKKSDLICDMENFVNNIKLLHYAAKLRY
jgi:hypothetical protein